MFTISSTCFGSEQTQCLSNIEANGKVHVLLILKKMTLFDFGLGSLIVLLEPKQIRVSFHTAVPVQQPLWADFKWSAEQRLIFPPRLLPEAAQVEERRPSSILSTPSRGTRWCVYYISWKVIYNGDDSSPLTIQPSIDVCTSQKWHGWNKKEEDNIG